MDREPITTNSISLPDHADVVQFVWGIQIQFYPHSIDITQKHLNDNIEGGWSVDRIEITSIEQLDQLIAALQTHRSEYR